MASVKPEESCLSSYRKLLLKLSSDLTRNDLEKLKFAAVDFIPRGRTENMSSGIQFFEFLEQDLKIGPRNLGLLQEMFEIIGRVDLARKVQPFSTAAIKVEADGDRDDMVTDGGGDNTEQDPAIPGSSGASRAEIAQVGQLVRQPLLYSANDGGECGATAAFNAMSLSGDQGAPQIGQCFAVCSDTSSAGNNDGIGSSSGLMGPAPAGLMGPSPAGLIGPAPAGLMGPAPAGLMGPAPAPSQAKQAGPQQRGAQALSSGRVQHDSSIGPVPVRYVNFLTCEGYTVEIIGGKHFKTPEGEFVEMKSGTQYQIHVKNTRAYGCNLDVSIDGYDVGGWTVDGGEELSIERPVYEPKKFTFYRVKTAPKEAGIESGRSENGVVKCVFTPEAFFNVLVIISGSSQPLNVDMPPSATVGDLKREVQSQLKASYDPDQVLVQGDKELSNSERLRNILEPPSENLILIDVEIQITVQASSDKVFPVKIQPGKAKIHDLMKQIEKELKVPIMDQKLYLGKARLSDAPRRGLPRELICSPQPTVVAIVPEYIHITVEDQNGQSNAVKIDQEKTLKALMEELPSCSYLQENEEAMFYLNGKQLCPTKDEGSLTSLGVRSGSVLELKIKILFIEIFIKVSCLRYTPPISVRCSPQDTFQDLVKQMEIQGKKIKQERVTFVMEERVFDPDQDKGPLQDYGVKHRSALQMTVVRPDSPGVQASQSADEVNIAVGHTLDTLGDSLDELQEMRKEKKSFLSGIKSKFNRKDKKERVKEMEAASSPPTPPSSRQSYRYESSPPLRRHRFSEESAVDTPYAASSVPSCVEEECFDRVTEPDPAWRSGGTTLQGYSTQQFMTADPIKVDNSRKVELVVRLVAREDEKDVVFPEGEFKPLSTLYPPAVPE